MSPYRWVRCGLLVCVMYGLAGFSTVQAADVIRRKSVPQPVSGEITAVTKNDVTVKPRTGDPVVVPVSDIKELSWDGEPAALRLGRSDELGGRYERALQNYDKAADDAKSGRPELLLDIQFAKLRTQSAMAENDPAKLAAAITALEEFRKQNSDSYQYFSGIALLGDLYLLNKDFTKATTTLELLGKSSMPDHQMAAKIATGRLAIAEGRLDDAATAFDSVIALPAATPAEVSQRQIALLGKVRLQLSKSEFDPALKLLNEEILPSTAADDAAVQAEAYLLLGDGYRGAGKSRDAVLAYLHIDVLFASQSAAHAEALYQLSQLWPKVGHPGRGIDARERLETEFPQSPWTARLKATPAPAGE